MRKKSLYLWNDNDHDLVKLGVRNAGNFNRLQLFV